MRSRPWRGRHSSAVVAMVVAATVILGPPTEAQQLAADGWTPQTYARGPADNPLKGFIPFRGAYNTFPHSMEWDYIPWKDLQSGFDTFTWEPLDAKLDEIAARGHQASFRIYADYPDAPSALPAFLSDVPKRAYADYGNGTMATSYSPDYDDRNLVRALGNIVKALGRRYDGDPRVGFITVGFIGFWGEWHTYRPECQCDSWMPRSGTQRRVIKTFDKAFKRTPLLVRYPDVGWDEDSVGFHDDSFARETIDPPEWTFMARIKRARATDQWQKFPVGGELRPEDQPCTFAITPCNELGQDFDASVDATHASWLINQHAFQTGYTGEDYVRALAGAQKLGYDLFVSSVRIRNTTASGKLTVELTIQNKGVAPFYYNWPIQLAVADADNKIIAAYNTRWKLTQVKLHAVDVRFSHSVRRHRLAAGTYTLLMRAVNPLPNGKPLVFANATWSDNLSNWLTLGTIDVRPR